MPGDVDLIILGGGCAGLSLGLRLAEYPGACGRVLIIELRPAYACDRTWCFWRLAPHRFDTLIRHRWSRVAVRDGHRCVVADCRATPYQMLASDDFYAHACRIIASSTLVSLVPGTAVLGAARRVGKRWQIDTSRGELSAGAIIDTRPPKTVVDDVLLWQSFSGQEISCDTSPFNPSTVELMDFAPATATEVSFTYVLPMTPARALVETTVFSRYQRPPAALAGSLAHAVSRACKGAPFEIHRTEGGLLPMGWRQRHKQSPDDALHAGVMHGGARPATGYAFERIQRWAHAAAWALRCGRPAPAHRPDPPVTRAMDQLLLQVLRAHPALGPRLFIDLFSRTDPARIIRFLSDKATVVDHLAMVAALPARPFLHALLAGDGARRSAPGVAP